LQLKTFVFAVVLIVIILVSILAVALFFSNSPPEKPEFYIGVEVAYTNANVNDIREMVDKVRNYTNLLVIGSIELSFNQTALTESCDYIYDAGLNIMVLFTDDRKYSYDSLMWMAQAEQKYGDQFLGVYRYDEPGGGQLDNPPLRFVKNATSYAQVAEEYPVILKDHVDHYTNYTRRLFTADYGLYWWDYKASYQAIFAEFVGNQSRQRHIALCRGAAQAHNKSWGAIVTWKYDQAPFLEDGEELYSDLTLAFTAGAKYMIVFDYPKIRPYGTLDESHFDALKGFWDFSHNNPQLFGSSNAEVAYVAPADYGFGFRSAEDTIWGLFPADEFSEKTWSDVSTLIDQYDSRFDILFDDIQFDAVRKNYRRLFLWNTTIT